MLRRKEIPQWTLFTKPRLCGALYGSSYCIKRRPSKSVEQASQGHLTISFLIAPQTLSNVSTEL